jgi:hypothetical protein
MKAKANALPAHGRADAGCPKACDHRGMERPLRKRKPGELSLREAASWAGVSRETLRRACKAGRVQGSFREGEWWLSKSSVMAMWPEATAASEPPRLRLVRGGPATEAGKRASSQNALKHGIFAQQAVIREGKFAEDHTEFKSVLDAVCAALSPKNAYEHVKVEQIAVLEWRRRRLLQAERVEFQTSDLPSSFLYGRRIVFDGHEAHLAGAMRRLLDELATLRAFAA